MTTFEFAFDPSYRRAGLLFGITPRTTGVTVDGDRLDARFGPWHLHTPLGNITAVHLTGPYGFVKTAGPAHLSAADRGLTFATNGRRGLCISFREPVRGIEPTGRLRHPALTVTVADCTALMQTLNKTIG